MNEAPAENHPARRSTGRTLIVHGAFFIVSALLLSLGLWQLNRAEEKRTMLDLAAVSAAAPARPLIQYQDTLADAAQRYARVTITGVWKPKNQWLWDNRISEGKAGYEVLTPFETLSGLTVLVNRGWLPVGASRLELPDVSAGFARQATQVLQASRETVGADTQPEAISIEGVITRPSKGLASGPAIEPSTSWPKRVQYLDYAAFSAALGVDLVPALVQARPIDVPATEPWHLRGNWEPTETFGPSRHLGYAVQWFALLITLCFLYFWYALRPARASNR